MSAVDGGLDLKTLCSGIALTEIAALVGPCSPLGAPTATDECNDEQLERFFADTPMVDVESCLQDAFDIFPAWRFPVAHKLLQGVQKMYLSALGTMIQASIDDAMGSYDIILAKLEDDDDVKYMLVDVENASSDEDNAAIILEKAGSQGCLAVYAQYKKLESNPMLDPSLAARFETMLGKLDAARQKSFAALAEVHEASITQVRKLIGTNTVVTSCLRPLAENENRKDLACRTRRVLKRKNMKDALSPSMSLFLDQMAGPEGGEPAV